MFRKDCSRYQRLKGRYLESKDVAQCFLDHGVPQGKRFWGLLYEDSLLGVKFSRSWVRFYEHYTCYSICFPFVSECNEVAETNILQATRTRSMTGQSRFFFLPDCGSTLFSSPRSAYNLSQYLQYLRVSRRLVSLPRAVLSFFVLFVARL
jgi:hypothetical protein